MSLLSPDAVPKRRLTSQRIRNLLEKNVVNDLVLNKLEVIACRLVWRANTRKDGDRAKLLIANKRNNCDSIVSAVDGVLFFFSCVTVLENRKRKSPSGTDDDNTAKTTYPCVNYWVVTKKFVQNIEQTLFSKLMSSEMDITDIKSLRTRKKVNVQNIISCIWMPIIMSLILWF